MHRTTNTRIFKNVIPKTAPKTDAYAIRADLRDIMLLDLPKFNTAHNNSTTSIYNDSYSGFNIITETDSNFVDSYETHWEDACRAEQHLDNATTSGNINADGNSPSDQRAETTRDSANPVQKTLLNTVFL